MYRIHKVTNETQVNKLIELSKSLNFKFSEGSRMRKGANAPHVLSKYWYTRWFEWTAEQRQVVKDNYPQPFIRLPLQVWYLKFEAKVGMLDLMDYWVDQKTPPTIFALALQDNQNIHIDGKLVVANKGDIVEFSLGTLHEVKVQDRDSLWLCLMSRQKIK